LYITLKSIKRNLGLFNLEFEDLIIGGIFIIVFTILFLLKFYTTAIVVISLGAFSLVPMDYSKCNRMYKLFILFVKYLFKPKHYCFYKQFGGD